MLDDARSDYILLIQAKATSASRVEALSCPAIDSTVQLSSCTNGPLVLRVGRTRTLPGAGRLLNLVAVARETKRMRDQRTKQRYKAESTTTNYRLARRYECCRACTGFVSSNANEQ